MKLSVFLCSLLFLIPSPAQAADNPWQAEFDKFATDDTVRGDAAVDILFVGSSSIRLWDLGKSFPEIKPTPLNRGFGGSQFSDVAANFDLLVTKYKPRFVVLYSGDNDIANGKTADETYADFKKIYDQLRAKLPKTQLIVIAIKPSVQRWKLRATIQDVNARMATTLKDDKLSKFVDVWPPMLNDKGEPRPELFVEDGLHMNAEGYAIWAKLIEPLLGAGSE